MAHRIRRSSSDFMPPIPSTSFPPLASNDIFNDDDDDGWLDMPIIREDTSLSGLDEEDQRKYHYRHQDRSTGESTGTEGTFTTKGGTSNATGKLIDVDDYGATWRSKLDRGDESSYTRLRAIEDDDPESDEVHMRTKYLFDEDKAMTPLSQMQATKELLTEAQRIAYVGLCALTSREMVQSLKVVKKKELKAATANMELWALKIMGRLYYHMELETQEQKMIESLAEHGVLASDLVPALMTTHTVANPEYDPEEAAREAEDRLHNQPDTVDSDSDDELDEKSISDQTLVDEPTTPKPISSDITSTTPPTSPPIPTPSAGPTILPTSPTSPNPPAPGPIRIGSTTTKVLPSASLPPSTLPGTSTPLTTQSLSRTNPTLTLDIRWTILCDLFLILIADSVYDARSRVLLEQIAYKLGLGWLDVVRFEKRVSEALEIQEDVETLKNETSVEEARKKGRNRRYMMLGLATLGGGLVIGLSAGLLAPVIGLGLAGALTTVGVTGTGAFLGGTAGAAVITTGGVLTGSGIAVRGMAKRTQQVRTFDILPLHNNKRVNCILTVPGFMNGINDDVRLPFSVLDPIVGDVFSVLWEPEMIRETGSALQILTGEVLSQIGMTVLQATVMTGLMTALQWPIILTKLGYLIDNPWSNALDRAKGAGKVLADVLIKRHLGVRPITLVGFSLGARVIFYALLELAAQKAFGVVQDVFLLGATLTVSQSQWTETRAVVSGRYVNAFARNDWVLNYLFRATSGGVGTVAGLRPVEGVMGLENVDVTDKIAGHMSYRTFMPLILDQLGFPVFADFFDEPEEPEFDEERIVVREGETQKSGGWFSRKKEPTMPQKHVVRPPSTSGFVPYKKKAVEDDATTLNGSITPSMKEKGGESIKEEGGEGDDDLPPRMDTPVSHSKANGNGTASASATTTPTPSRPGTPGPGHSQHPSEDAGAGPTSAPKIPKHAGFDLKAIKSVLKEVESDSGKPSKPKPPPSPPSPPLPIPTPNLKTPSSSLASGTASVIPSSAPTTPATKKRSFFSRLASSSSPSSSAARSPSGSPIPTPLALQTPSVPNRSHSTPPEQVLDVGGVGVRRSLDYASSAGLGVGAGSQWLDVPEMGLDERGLRTTGSSFGVNEFGGGFGGGGFASATMPSYSRSVSSFARLEDSGMPSAGSLGAMAVASASGVGALSNAHSSFLSSLPDDAVPSWGASSSSSSSSSLNLATPTTAKPFSVPSTSASTTTDYPNSFSYSTSNAFSSTPSMPFTNPFASGTQDRTPVLSFGAGDEVDEGDIGVGRGRGHGATSSRNWEMPPISGKKTLDSALGSNPWS